MGSRIIIADDHPLLRAALRQTLADHAIDEAGGFDELLGLLDDDRDCDLVLLDLAMPGPGGLTGLLRLRTEYAEVPVLVVSAEENGGVIRRALELGASGYLVKSASPAEIREAVAAVLRGEVYLPGGIDLPGAQEAEPLRRLASLTPQQVRVLLMLGDGLMNKQIAHALSISEATVKVHVSSILQKLGVDSRTQAVIALARLRDGAGGAA